MQTFNETGLNPEILKAIGELGFETPTPIQAKTIPTLLESGQDLVALAQTGTGKTAAFGLPLVNSADIQNPHVQGLILCPTRELCLQITKDLQNFAKYLPKISIVPVYGGTDIRKQITDLRRGCQIVVGTPGRVNDLVGKGLLKVQDCGCLILDEADEMLNMGFKEELDAIIGETPEWRQTLLFSATMANEVAKMANRYMQDYQEIKVGNKNEGSTTIEHLYYMVQARDRYLALKRIADITPNIYGIVFCRTRQETKDVADKLMADGYNADALHGDLSQAQRDMVMNRFRSRNLQILVATDVAARGIDVNDLTHVINYNLPDDIEVYTHRSGRTGRAGKKGTSIVIIHMRELGRIKAIERITKRKFERAMVPTGDQICEKQLFHLIDRVENVEMDNAKIDQFLPAIYEKLEAIDKEDLIKRFVSVEFNNFLAYYENATDLNVSESRQSRTSDRGSAGRSNFSRLFLNLGKAKNLTPQDVIGLINKNSRKRGVEIGKIEILRNFTFFEIAKGSEKDITDALNGVQYNGEKVVVEPASSKPPKRTFRKGGGGNFRKGEKSDRFPKNDRGDRGDREDRKERRPRRY